MQNVVIPVAINNPKDGYAQMGADMTADGSSVVTNTDDAAYIRCEVLIDLVAAMIDEKHLPG